MAGFRQSLHLYSILPSAEMAPFLVKPVSNNNMTTTRGASPCPTGGGHIIPVTTVKVSGRVLTGATVCQLNDQVWPPVPTP